LPAAVAAVAAIADKDVTWVKLQSHQLDIVGLVLGSLGLAGLLAAGALGLGSLVGVFIIRRRRRATRPTWIADGTLSLGLGVRG
jgi:hypothetical protein